MVSLSIYLSRKFFKLRESLLKKMQNKKQKEKDIHTHVILVAGFVQKGDKYLIARRKSDDPQAGGKWSLPGGKVDFDIGGQIIEKTLQREINEEVGVKITGEIEFLGNNAFIRSSGHHVVALVFLCYWKSGIAKPLEGHDKILWLTLEELRNFKDADPFFIETIDLLVRHLS
ncbi:MAG: NUDIX hydrolase [Candidatus Woesebacteria bacterium GW2011_GWB1_39_10b]|uniref:8-oxo-dGTP diphosphatase n=1 Tax=Candidatus Woesebacteria bacterium GW2011_GWB1_39_10b TaxID=1618573 RepID=A0A0G0P7F9_9BACT|nr:MAG: NUDIX hydrolase [Candidatus Woesebacteria bacterium GW2011_GWB1_39_10b]